MALRLGPDSAETCFNRGLAFAAAGDREKALADLQLARKLGYALTDQEVQAILQNVKR
jgi:regulator of sirC expression with transglutaminase-like and TPR domain